RPAGAARHSRRHLRRRPRARTGGGRPAPPGELSGGGAGEFHGRGSPGAPHPPGLHPLSRGRGRPRASRTPGRSCRRGGEARSLRGGAVKPWQTKSYEECQEDLERFAKLRGVALDTPWRELPAEARRWVIEGEGPWTKKVWYGVQRFFAWLETRAYKMHVRVL